MSEADIRETVRRRYAEAATTLTDRLVVLPRVAAAPVGADRLRTGH